MSEERRSAKIGERESQVHHQDLFDADDSDPCRRLVETVAELKNADPKELRPLYTWVDGLVTDLYSSPPPADAQAVVEFSYEGYRITLYQDGHAVFMTQS